MIPIIDSDNIKKGRGRERKGRLIERRKRNELLGKER